MNRFSLLMISCIVALILFFAHPEPAAAYTTNQCGVIASDQTWTAGQNVHVVTCHVSVANGVTLTIEPGAIVKFNIGTELSISGTLRISGSPSQPVYLTSIHDDSIGGDTNGNGGATTPNWDDWRGIVFNDSSDDNSLIEHAVIRHTGRNNRASLNLVGASPTIRNSVLSNGYLAVMADLASFPAMTGNQVSGNSFNGVGLPGGTISTNTTWNLTDTSLIVMDEIFVGVGTTLTIEPGVVVKFPVSRTLTIDGALRVLGTAQDPVILTSVQDDSVGGDTNGDGGATAPHWDNWRGITFRDSSSDTNSLVEHAVIRYSGRDFQAAINLAAASPVIRNITVSDSYMALRADLASFPVLQDNQYIQNYFNGLGVSGGTIQADSTWKFNGTTYYVIDDIFVGTGKTLTIEPGVVIKFNISREITVDGTLRVLGTALNPVTFTSINDDSVGGDTNGDGGATIPNWDHWRGIAFRDSSDDAQTLIEYAVIRYSGRGYRAALNLTGASPTIRHTTIAHGYMAVQADLVSFPVLEDNLYLNSFINGMGLSGGTIQTAVTWNLTGTTYYVIDEIFIGVGAALTVEPGVVIKFPTARGLTVDGTLRVLGTAQSPVTFTAVSDDSIGGDTNGDGSATTPAWDHWVGITFRENSDDVNSILDYAVIRYSGRDYRGAVNMVASSPAITNSTFAHGHIALRADLRSFPTLNGNQYTGNAYNALGIDGGTINGNAAWSQTDISYYVIDRVFVGTGASLTIGQGVVVKFEIGRDLVVDGALRITGSAQAPVYLTSKHDDSIGGDTNGDGSATSPRWDHWRGIEFRDSSSDSQSLVEYAVIRYGGRDYRGGINLSSASPTIRNTILTANFAGIAAANSQPRLGCNHILLNEGFGINNTTPQVMLRAANQWWGSFYGPQHPLYNENGKDNRVSDGVLFHPWLFAPCGENLAVTALYMPLIRR